MRAMSHECAGVDAVRQLRGPHTAAGRGLTGPRAAPQMPVGVVDERRESWASSGLLLLSE